MGPAEAEILTVGERLWVTYREGGVFDPAWSAVSVSWRNQRRSREEAGVWSLARGRRSVWSFFSPPVAPSSRISRGLTGCVEAAALGRPRGQIFFFFLPRSTDRHGKSHEEKLDGRIAGKLDRGTGPRRPSSSPKDAVELVGSGPCDDSEKRVDGITVTLHGLDIKIASFIRVSCSVS